jgi:AcrR family transcriptional regulator
MTSEGAASATRDSLLDAAKRVIQLYGAAHLTLDAVAKEARVSKGGLLYHFPNKQALLKGMMTKGIRHHAEEMAQAVGPNPARGAFARHFLRQSVIGPDPCVKPPVEIVWSMIAAAANDPTLLEPVREMHGEWQKQLEEDLANRDVATIVRLIGHGLWSAELFGFSVPDPAQRERILSLLSKLAGLDQDPRPSGNENEGEKEMNVEETG